MIDQRYNNLTEEERAEFWAQCALWQAEAVAAQDAEMVADELGRQSDAQVALSLIHI